jgi:hypothetical protein
LWGFQSDIIPNVPSYDGNLMTITSIPNYFYEEKNREQVRWNCYDVMDEILKRMNCSLRSIYGIYWITGLEGIHNTRATNLHYYDVDGDFVASTAPSITSLNILSQALAGGIYNYQAGYKRLTWDSDKEYSNRGFGSGIYWSLYYPATVVPEFKTIGFADSSILYKVKVNVNVQSITKIDPTFPINEFFYVKINIKGKNITTNVETTLFNDDLYLIPTIVGDYFYEFSLYSEVYDREIIVSVGHQEFDPAMNIDQLLFNVNVNLTETGQKYDSIKVISTIEDSTNPTTKVIKTKGMTGIVLFETSSVKDLRLFILKNNIWTPAEPEDIKDFQDIINATYFFDKDELAQHVGFMGFENKAKYMIFKVKDTTKKRHIGSRCDQAGKIKTIKLLNEILGDEVFDKENTKGIVQQELCVRQEFLLRNLDKEEVDGKRWFLDVETAVVTNNE